MVNRKWLKNKIISNNNHNSKCNNNNLNYWVNKLYQQLIFINNLIFNNYSNKILKIAITIIIIIIIKIKE